MGLAWRVAAEPNHTTVRTVPQKPSTEQRPAAAFLTLALESGHPERTPRRRQLHPTRRLFLGRGGSDSQPPGPGSDFLAIEDSRLSRRHAELLCDADGSWAIRDLCSTNGTFHNGQRVTEAPLQSNDIIQCGRSVLLFRMAQSRVGAAQPPPLDVPPGFWTLNPSYEEALERLSHVARTNLPVVLLGETGTGKEVTARGIHEVSARPGPFIALNCGALSSGLAEAQLFGHVRGAFSGAVKDGVGFVRAAQYGTLFLDEVAELPASTQVLLLRVLEAREVTPVGSVVPCPVDFRVLAATNRSLDQLVEAGEFRRDLYARLAGFVHEIPPLRERLEDLGGLIGAWQRQQSGASLSSLRAELALELFRHPWPLNTRGLFQSLASACVVARGEPLGLEHWDFGPSGAGASTRPSDATELCPADQKLRGELVALLAEYQGNLAAVGRRLGKARQQVQRWVVRLGIDVDRYRR